MKKPTISIIASIGKNRELGRNNDLIWKIPGDLKYFKKVTLGHPVIMGENTFRSIGKPLPGRTNIVLSRDKNFACKGCLVAGSIDEAIQTAQRVDKKEIFFIGGGKVYEQAIKNADRLYLTIVDDTKPADTYFPNYSEFGRSREIDRGIFEGTKYQFMIFEK